MYLKYMIGLHGEINLECKFMCSITQSFAPKSLRPTHVVVAVSSSLPSRSASCIFKIMNDRSWLIPFRTEPRDEPALVIVL